MSIEAMKLMVHELEYVLDCINKDKIPFDGDDFHEALRLGRQAIEQAEKQEPVAYPDGYVVGPCICGSWPGGKCLKCPRITPQPQREWVRLTDEEVVQVLGNVREQLDGNVFGAFARSIETKLKEKNT